MTRLTWNWGRAADHSLAVLGDLAVQDVVALILGGADGVGGADADAAAAAHALVLVDAGLVVHNVGRVVGADLDAAAAAHAEILLDVGLAGAVHLHLAGAGAAGPCRCSSSVPPKPVDS